MKAPQLLQKAADIMIERGKQYDKPEGERSMGAAVRAFNAITGKDLTEPEGWLLLQVLKDVRQWQNPERYHADSAEDCIAYAALKAEALASPDPIINNPERVRIYERDSMHWTPERVDAFNNYEPASEIDDDSPRMQAIGQNGNDGAVYDRPQWKDAPEWAFRLVCLKANGWLWICRVPLYADFDEGKTFSVKAGDFPLIPGFKEARPC